MAIYIIYKRLALDFPRVWDYNVGRLICAKEEDSNEKQVDRSAKTDEK